MRGCVRAWVRACVSGFVRLLPFVSERLEPVFASLFVASLREFREWLHLLVTERLARVSKQNRFE